MLNVASEGKLKDPAVLEQQVRRMLADTRSETLVTNFADQWLYLRNLKNIQPDFQTFPDFDDNLRQAMKRETELFFGSIIREEPQRARSVERRLHVRQRAPGPALRDSEHLRDRLPARDDYRSDAARSAGAGKHPDRDVDAEPHVAGAARQVDSDQSSRQPADSAAARTFRA